MARAESLTVLGLNVRDGEQGHHRPCGQLIVANESRSYHHPKGVQRASGRLAVLPFGMIVEPSRILRAWLRIASKEMSPQFTLCELAICIARGP